MKESRVPKVLEDGEDIRQSFHGDDRVLADDVCNPRHRRLSMRGEMKGLFWRLCSSSIL